MKLGAESHSPEPSASATPNSLRSVDRFSTSNKLLEGRNRFEVLNQLWGLLARADVSLDLLLYSERECQERREWRTHVIGRAFREGRLLDGAF